jgi:tetratricopeptide (TPR) repeat protein
LSLAPALFFLCALFSKESSIAFIAAIPLLLYYSDKCEWKAHTRALIPYLTAASVFLAARYLAVGAGSSASGDRILYNTLHAAGNASELWGTKLGILLQFLKQSIFPYTLSYDYSFNQLPVTGLLSTTALLSLVLHLLLGFIVVRGISRKDPVAFGIAFFFIASIVTNNLLYSIGTTFAERFLYLPVAGMLVAIAAAATQLKDRLFADRRNRYLLPTLALLVLFVFVTLASDRIPAWSDNSTLYQSGLETSPRSARVHFDVGSNLLTAAGGAIDPSERIQLLEQAERELKKSVEILPEYTEALYNLAVLSIQRGDTVSAIAGYKLTLETDTAHRPSLINTAYLHLMQSETDSSRIYLNKLMRIYPNDNDGLLNLSHLYYLEKDTLRAKYFATEGMRLYPEVAFHYRNMAAACLLAGDSAEASKYLDQFLYRGGGR